MSRKIIALSVALLFIVSCSLTAMAQDVDVTRLGSLSVSLADQDEPLVGAELSVYHVAKIQQKDGAFSYVCTEDFEAFSADVAESDLAVRLDAFTAERDLPHVKMATDSQGVAKCDGLELGLYFVKQTGAVEGFAPCTPFVVTIPFEGDDGYEYDVNATPKTEASRLVSITITKVWNTDASTKAADSVTVQLLRDGNVVETAVLSDENGWAVTYSDMPAGDGYSVAEVDVPKGFTATYSQSGYDFTVTNTSTLIQTGQLIWPIPVLAVGGMLLVALGVALLHGKRKENA